MRWGKGLITGVFLLLISACSDENGEEESGGEDLNEVYDIDSEPVEITGYGNDVLTVETSEYRSFATGVP
ncbi:hypothetical protein HUG20_03990 [Salicibibacter cibi]|uniref:Uncharacterized protein n=1 Tax=Salicibibacter cibi TaxID=2743001 RepID=A0A7T6Z974_9BACI|nr:hypothetical protein [Salicibibacter cibi]QQK79146.1 hypothetical protein HUG20_03990 [Salicibibacter cibi]